jgi:hypothetical protein
VSSSEPYGIPTARTPSAAPLVNGIREHVDAWRAAGYPGSSETTRRLLEHWFLDEHHGHRERADAAGGLGCPQCVGRGPATTADGQEQDSSGADVGPGPAAMAMS